MNTDAIIQFGKELISVMKAVTEHAENLNLLNKECLQHKKQIAELQKAVKALEKLNKN